MRALVGATCNGAAESVGGTGIEGAGLTVRASSRQLMQMLCDLDVSGSRVQARSSAARSAVASPRMRSRAAVWISAVTAWLRASSPARA